MNISSSRQFGAAYYKPELIATILEPAIAKLEHLSAFPNGECHGLTAVFTNEFITRQQILRVGDVRDEEYQKMSRAAEAMCRALRQSGERISEQCFVQSRALAKGGIRLNRTPRMLPGLCTVEQPAFLAVTGTGNPDADQAIAYYLAIHLCLSTVTEAERYCVQGISNLYLFRILD